MKIVKRDGTIVNYDPEKIRRAIKKANTAATIPTIRYKQQQFFLQSFL